MARCVHLVLIDGSDPLVALATEELVADLRPLVTRLTHSGLILDAAFGHRLDVERRHRPAGPQLDAFDSFTRTVHLEFADASGVAEYYGWPEHAALRLRFYRRLPALAELWGEYDAKPPGQRDTVFSRIEEVVTRQYVRRVDYVIELSERKGDDRARLARP